MLWIGQATSGDPGTFTLLLVGFFVFGGALLVGHALRKKPEEDDPADDDSD